MIKHTILLAAMVLAAMALLASSASAVETPIHIENEETLAPCDPCFIEFDGEHTWVAHTIFGEIPVSHCQDEFEAEIYEDGSGHIVEYHNNHAASGTECSRRMGNGATHGSEWPIHSQGEEGGNTGHMWLDVAWDAENNPGGADIECEMKIGIEETTQHQYHLTADYDCPFAELDGSWRIENDGSHEPIEIVHLDDV